MVAYSDTHKSAQSINARMQHNASRPGEHINNATAHALEYDNTSHLSAGKVCQDFKRNVSETYFSFLTPFITFYAN